MSDEDATWQEASPVAENSTSTVSPASALLSPSSDSNEPWMIAASSHSTADRHVTAARMPPIALPVPQHTEAGRRHKVATTVPPDTPELAEAGPSAPAYASRKPPRPFNRQTKQYERSNLGDPDHVPVNWIGDSTDHADYRPTNTASFSNHEPDIVRVATFSTHGQKHDDVDTHDSMQDMPQPRSSKRRWPVWALLGMVAGTAIGVAYKLLRNEAVVRRSGTTKQYCAAAFSQSKPQVTASDQSKTISDDELVQYLVRRKARKVSQT